MVLCLVQPNYKLYLYNIMATVESAYQAGYAHGKERGITLLTHTYASNGTNEGADRAYALSQAWYTGMKDGAKDKAETTRKKPNNRGNKSRKSRKSKKSRKSRRYIYQSNYGA